MQFDNIELDIIARPVFVQVGSRDSLLEAPRAVDSHSLDYINNQYYVALLPEQLPMFNREYSDLKDIMAIDVYEQKGQLIHLPTCFEAKQLLMISGTRLFAVIIHLLSDDSDLENQLIDFNDIKDNTTMPFYLGKKED